MSVFTLKSMMVGGVERVKPTQPNGSRCPVCDRWITRRIENREAWEYCNHCGWKSARMIIACVVESTPLAEAFNIWLREQGQVGMGWDEQQELQRRIDKALAGQAQTLAERHREEMDRMRDQCITPKPLSHIMEDAARCG